MSDLLSLSELAYQAMRRDILACRLLPGALVTESELMERYQSGKSTIRLTLTRLSHEKLVISRPRRGYHIVPVTLQEMEEIFTLRAALEPLAARLAVGKVDIQKLQDIEAQCMVGIAAPLSTRIDLFISANKRFHLTIAEATGNQHLTHILAGLMDKMARLVTLGFNVQRIHPEVQPDHQAIIAAFVAQDAEQVERLSRQHIEALHTVTREKIQATLGKEGKLLPVFPLNMF